MGGSGRVNGGRENRESIGDAHDHLLVDAKEPEAFKRNRNLVEGGAEDVVCDLVFDAAWRGVMNERYFGTPTSGG